jgi:hypothetical protein
MRSILWWWAVPLLACVLCVRSDAADPPPKASGDKPNRLTMTIPAVDFFAAAPKRVAATPLGDRLQVTLWAPFSSRPALAATGSAPKANVLKPVGVEARAFQGGAQRRGPTGPTPFDNFDWKELAPFTSTTR